MTVVSRALTLLLGLLVVLSGAAAANADESYPNRPIRLIVPWGTGGYNDALARILTPSLTRTLGQPVVIENRPGATGTIGSSIAARAAPDGYTILLATADTHAIASAVSSRLQYDPMADFVPVTLLSKQPVLFWVRSSLPVKTMAEFVELAKRKPGEISYASIGLGSSTHLGAELFNLTAGIKLNHVPFKGSGPGMLEVLGGRVDSILVTMGGAGGQATSGALRPLAIMDSERSSMAPQVPTMAEVGFPKVELILWSGIVAPKGTPRAIVDRLNKEFRTAMQSEESTRFFAGLGFGPIASSPEEFGAYMSTEIEKWKAVAKAADVHLD